GEDALDAREVIAGLAQVAQRLNDRQAGTDVGFVEKVGAALAPRLPQAAIESHVGTVGFLVRRDDMDTGGEPLRIVPCHLRAGRAVDQNAVWQVLYEDVLDERLHVRGSLALLVLRAPPVQRHTRVREHHPLRPQQPAYAQVELGLSVQALALRGDLVQQDPADRARTDHADGQSVRREVQAGMDGTQRSSRALTIDDDRNIPLRGALCDRAHIHGGGAERVEHLPRDAGGAGHAVTDDCKDGQLVVDGNALYLSFVQLTLEGTAHHGCCTICLRLRDGTTDRVLGAALRDQDDRDPLLAQRAEQAVRGARHADHAGALHVHQRHLLDARDALDGQLRGRLGADERAGLLGREGVADPDRNVAADRGCHGLRVDDLGAEV